MEHERRPVPLEGKAGRLVRCAWVLAALVIAELSATPGAQAQERRADAGLAASLTHYGEFNQGELGLGLRFGYRLARSIALDVHLGFEPGDLGGPAFSAHRLEAEGGLVFGPDLRSSGPYIALRGGVSRFASAPEPILCPAIYPPFLDCELAAGKTLPSAGLGAGYAFETGGETVVRIEVADQLLRFPGPAITSDGPQESGDFWRHNFRAMASVGRRF